MRVEEWPVDRIRPYEDNPRYNDSAVAAVANSIEQFGWKQPIVVDSDGVVVAGHTRLKAAKLLGMDMVPVVVASDLTPEQCRAYRLADNSSGGVADWNYEMLKGEIASIPEFDMSQFGFGKFELATLMDVTMNSGREDEDLEEDSDILEQYESHEHNFLKRERIIITYTAEQLPELIEILGVGEIDHVVYTLDDIVEARNDSRD